MTPADVLPPVDGRIEADRIADGAVALAVDGMLRSGAWDVADELGALDAVTRAAARLAAARRPGRRNADVDAPVPMAGWWSFAAQLPELDL